LNTRTLSTETRNKISAALKGRTFSEESRKKMSDAKLGEKNHRSTVTEDIVSRFKRDKYNKFYSLLDLRKKYNMSLDTAKNISSGRTWKHINAKQPNYYETGTMIATDNLIRICNE
jgi:hypothetical protein